MLEGLGRLHERAQGDPAEDVAGRADEHREGHGQHRVAGAEHEDVAPGFRLHVEDQADFGEQFAELVPLAGLGVDQGDGLAVLLGLDQAGAELGLGGLALVGGAGQGQAHQPAEPGGERRVGDGDPHQVAVDRKADETEIERDHPGVGPQHPGEADEQEHAVEERMRQRHRRLGRHPAILGDAAVRVVVFARQVADQVMTAGLHPPTEHMLGQPVAPGDGQVSLDHQVPAGERHVGEEEQHEQAGLAEQTGHGMLLQGVEQAGAPLGDEHGHDHLQDRERRQYHGSEADLHFVGRVEERSGQPQEGGEKMVRCGHGCRGLGWGRRVGLSRV